MKLPFMNGPMFVLPVFAVALLCSCSKPTPGGMHATVVMRDGKTLAGTVLTSSASEIQLSGDDHVTQTIPMAQVSSVQYDSPATPAAAPAPAPVVAGAATTPPPLPVTASAPAPPPPASAPTPSSAPERYNSPPPPPPTRVEHYHPPEAAITTKTFALPAGSQISVRNDETIDSKKAVDGQTFAAEVTSEVIDAAGDVVIPRGSNAQIIIRSATKGGKIRGASDLVLDLASVSVDGREFDVSTTDLSVRGRDSVGANRRTAEYSGGGAAFGAIIGAIAGGGKGAAIGLGSGAGAGALTQILTKGTIKVPAETILTFKLDQPLRIKAAQ